MKACIGHGAFVDGVAVDEAVACGVALTPAVGFFGGKNSRRCLVCQRNQDKYKAHKWYLKRKRHRKHATCAGVTKADGHHPCTATFVQLFPRHERCPTCSAEHSRQSSKTRRARARDADNARKAKVHKAINPRRHIVDHGNQYMPATGPRKAQPKCQQCCDLCERRPRAPERCLCGLSWSAEEIDGPELMVSNAGWAVTR